MPFQCCKVYEEYFIRNTHIFRCSSSWQWNMRHNYEHRTATVIFWEKFMFLIVFQKKLKQLKLCDYYSNCYVILDKLMTQSLHDKRIRCRLFVGIPTFSTLLCKCSPAAVHPILSGCPLQPWRPPISWMEELELGCIGQFTLRTLIPFVHYTSV